MFFAFVIWSIVAAFFVGIGVSCRKSDAAVGFFTFVKPPVVSDVRKYNNAVAVLWFIAAAIMEIMGVPFLFFEQNSLVFIIVIFAMMLLVIGMMAAYIRIVIKYKIS